jgi:PhnB protein
MSATTTVHLNFRGQARAALERYQEVFGGEMTVVTYGQAGPAGEGQEPDHVIWGQVVSADGVHVMAFDVQAEKPYDPGTHAFYVSVRGDDVAQARGWFDALAGTGTVQTPFGPAMFAESYGMVTDEFGVVWIIDATTPQG